MAMLFAGKLTFGLGLFYGRTSKTRCSVNNFITHECAFFYCDAMSFNNFILQNRISDAVNRELWHDYLKTLLLSDMTWDSPRESGESPKPSRAGVDKIDFCVYLSTTLLPPPPGALLARRTGVQQSLGLEWSHLRALLARKRAITSRLFC